MALTKLQKETLGALIKFNTDYGYTPSIRVLASEMGYKGHSLVAATLQELFVMSLIEKNEKKYYQPIEKSNK